MLRFAITTSTVYETCFCGVRGSVHAVNETFEILGSASLEAVDSLSGGRYLGSLMNRVTHKGSGRIQEVLLIPEGGTILFS